MSLIVTAQYWQQKYVRVLKQKQIWNLNELERELIEEKFLLYQAVLYTELIKKKTCIGSKVYQR